MAENIPNIPTGAMPPKKETGKVQPKKETVRINLPPKPSAAPTIKLPTLPPGGPTGGPGASAPAPTLSTAAPMAPKPASAPAGARISGASAAPAAASRQAAPGAPRPAPAPATAPTLSTIDTVLAIAAAVIGLVAVGTTLYLIVYMPWGLPN